MSLRLAQPLQAVLRLSQLSRLHRWTQAALPDARPALLAFCPGESPSLFQDVSKARQLTSAARHLLQPPQAHEAPFPSQGLLHTQLQSVSQQSCVTEQGSGIRPSWPPPCIDLPSTPGFGSQSLLPHSNTSPLLNPALAEPIHAAYTRAAHTVAATVRAPSPAQSSKPVDSLESKLQGSVGDRDRDERSGGAEPVHKAAAYGSPAAPSPFRSSSF